MSLIQTDGLTLGFVLFVLTVLFGFLLMRSGKPYRTGIFNIHKLIALASAVLYVYSFFLITKSASSGLISSFQFYGASGILILTLFGTGAMLSIGKPDSKGILIAHRCGAALATMAVLLLIYLQMNRLL